ncbi:DUF308 domain-containing protein [Mesorhizobium sp. SP-1A]|uniref:DUF308 domain-containing protein n=1 Tax=Mesorhizobium sp. SP-1A TaxID=3077840 RepID=UPI0028F74CB4|nr:DUF308 domain-containing protein [Mesorhizobium sp. SP-1A]
MLRKLIVLSTAYFLGFTSVAFAQEAKQGTTVGTLLSNFIKESWNPIFLLIVVAMGVTGIYFIARGLTNLVEATRQNGRHNYSAGIVMMLAGAMLVSLPDVAGVGMTSLLGSARGGGVLGSAELDYNDQGMGGDFLNSIAGPLGSVGTVENCIGHAAPATCMAANVARNVVPMAVMALFSIVFLAGLISFAMAIIELARNSERGDNRPGKLTKLITAVLLMNAPLFYTILTTTLLGSVDNPIGMNGLNTSSDLLKYPIASNLEVVQRFAELIGHAFTILTFFGAWAFVRGIFMVKGIAEGKDNRHYGMAITYMVAGILMANSKFSACVILGTFGGSELAKGFC